MKKKTFNFYSDPSHGWLAVKRNYLKQLNILNEITRYSYEKGQTVYLEEDKDMALFLSALEKNKTFYLIKEHFTNKMSQIRYYNYFELIQEDLD